MKFDLLIKGGTVIDPANGRNQRLDVAVNRDRIAAVEPEIPADSAFTLIDASDHYVTPGLVDLHSHVYRGVTYTGIDADAVASRSGVTTWIDAGSAGAMNIQGLREYIVERTVLKIFAFMNISCIGLIGPDYELNILDYCDTEIFRRVLDLNRDFVVGVKVRMHKENLGGNGIEPLRRARQAADECGLPMMVHIATSPPDIDEILGYLHEGDILTHCFTGLSHRILADDGTLRECAERARERGVILDIGHGTGSFSFEVTEQLLASGVAPDVISTDIHQLSINGPMFDLPTCMTKFLALGMTLEDVVRATTIAPATVLNLGPEAGTLTVGARADIAVFTLLDGNFPMYDITMDRRVSPVLLRNTETIVAGRVMLPRPLPPPAPWIGPDPIWPGFEAEIATKQGSVVEQGHTPDAMAQAATRPQVGEALAH
jgi:dihydroorotase